MASATTPMHIRSDMANLIGPEPYIIELPNSIQGIIYVLYQLRRHTVQLIAARLKRNPPGAVSDVEWKKLTTFLSILYNLETLDPKMKSEAQLDRGLKVIYDPTIKFPAEYQRVARFLFEKFEAERWGADEVEEDVIAGEGEASAPGVVGELPDDSDPIYGIAGIMHHILRIKGPKMIAYQLDQTFVRNNDFKTFGHNGFEVGQCWPLQIALLRDGAHGQRVGGISGTATHGTYSIVVSGAYDGMDQDQGNTIYYSGSNSHDNKSSEPVTSNQTKALERSIATGRPVRVFRSSAGKWISAPKAGIRYDGLYIVVGATVETNAAGGAYKRFRLDRVAAQAPININEPSPDLINQFKCVQNGYTRTRPRIVPAAALSS